MDFIDEFIRSHPASRHAIAEAERILAPARPTLPNMGLIWVKSDDPYGDIQVIVGIPQSKNHFYYVGDQNVFRQFADTGIVLPEIRDEAFRMLKTLHGWQDKLRAAGDAFGDKSSLWNDRAMRGVSDAVRNFLINELQQDNLHKLKIYSHDSCLSEGAFLLNGLRGAGFARAAAEIVARAPDKSGPYRLSANEEGQDFLNPLPLTPH